MKEPTSVVIYTVAGTRPGGFVVALVALAVSIPVSIATVGFYIAFRLAEDYLLTPRIIGRAVKVPGGVTVVAVLIGAALLGVVGALLAIPVAAALQLLVLELLFPTLDEASSASAPPLEPSSCSSAEPPAP